MKRLILILFALLSLQGFGQIQQHGMFYRPSGGDDGGPPVDKAVFCTIDNTVYKSTDGGRTFDGGQNIGASTSLRFGDISEDEQTVVFSNTVPTNNTDEDVGHYSSNGGTTWTTRTHKAFGVYGCYTATAAKDGTAICISMRDIVDFSFSSPFSTWAANAHNYNAGGVHLSVTGDTAYLTAHDRNSDILRSINNSSFSVLIDLPYPTLYLNDASDDKSVFVSEVHATSQYHKMNIANLNTGTYVNKTVAASSGNLTNCHCSESGAKIITRDHINFILYYSENSGSTFTGVSFATGVGNTTGRFKLTKDGNGVYYYNYDGELYYATWDNMKTGTWTYLTDVGSGSSFIIVTY